jgi:hypothetical protein
MPDTPALSEHLRRLGVPRRELVKVCDLVAAVPDVGEREAWTETLLSIVTVREIRAAVDDLGAHPRLTVAPDDDAEAQDTPLPAGEEMDALVGVVIPLPDDPVPHLEDALTTPAPDVIAGLPSLTVQDPLELRYRETNARARKTVLRAIDEELGAR